MYLFAVWKHFVADFVSLHRSATAISVWVEKIPFHLL